MKTKLIIAVIVAFLLTYFDITSFLALTQTDGIMQQGFFSEYRGSHVFCYGFSVTTADRTRCFGTLGFIGE